MPPKTTTRKTTAPKTEPVAVHPLAIFDDRLILTEGFSAKTDQQAILSKVIFGETLAAMYEAQDAALPALPTTAKASERSAKHKQVLAKVLEYVTEKTTRYYSASSVTAWMDAGRTNQRLPEHIRVTITGDDPATATVDGFFGVWPLQYLGNIEDDLILATVAEDLATRGVTTQQGVKQAVADATATPLADPPQPKSAADMTDTLVGRMRKTEGETVGRIAQILTVTDTDNALALIDFGRLLWTKTPSDSAEDDTDKRNRKRLEVFRAAAEQLSYPGSTHDDVAGDGDGAEAGSEPVL